MHSKAVATPGFSHHDQLLSGLSKLERFKVTMETPLGWFPWVVQGPAMCIAALLITSPLSDRAMLCFGIQSSLSHY